MGGHTRILLSTSDRTPATHWTTHVTFTRPGTRSDAVPNPFSPQATQREGTASRDTTDRDGRAESYLRFKLKALCSGLDSKLCCTSPSHHFCARTHIQHTHTRIHIHQSEHGICSDTENVSRCAFYWTSQPARIGQRGTKRTESPLSIAFAKLVVDNAATSGHIVTARAAEEKDEEKRNGGGRAECNVNFSASPELFGALLWNSPHTSDFFALLAVK